MSNENSVPASPVLRRREAAQYLRLSLASLHRRMSDPDFPRALRLGPNTVAFLRRDLDAWLAGRAGK